MVFPKARVVVSACLFLVWIGFLLYLVLVTRDPVVVSRPQLLVADVCVLAEVSAPGERPSTNAKVTKVLWSRAATDADLAGRTVSLDALPDVGPDEGFTGVGEYLIPLAKRRGKGNVEFDVAPLPPMPGFYARQQLELLEIGPNQEAVLQLAVELGANLPKNTEALPLPRVLRRNLTWRDAETWQGRLMKVGAKVRPAEGEFRIYRAIPDVLAQLREVYPE